MIHHNMERAAYDALPGINWSTLKHALKSPAHYRSAVATKAEDKAAFLFGRVFHAALFEPQRLEVDVAVWDGDRRGKEWTAFKEANAGRDIVKAEEMADIRGMVASVRSRPDIVAHLTGGAELSFQFESGGMQCKGRVDLLAASGLLIDGKSAADASPDGFGRAAWPDYLGQMAWYFDGLRAAGESPFGAALLAVEKTAPYACALYVLEDWQLDMGRKLYRRALDVVKRCTEANDWPSYEAVQPLRLPKWALTEESES